MFIAYCSDNISDSLSGEYLSASDSLFTEMLLEQQMIA